MREPSAASFDKHLCHPAAPALPIPCAHPSDTLYNMSLPFDPKEVEYIECVGSGDQLKVVQVNFKKGGHASFIGADLTDEIRRYVVECERLNPGSTVH